MELEDFFYSYPDYNDPDIQLKILNLKEFNQLRTKEIETKDPNQIFFKHQIITKRLMYFLDRLFIIHEAGTGKTGVLSATAESYKEGFNNILISSIEEYIRPFKRNIKRVYVILRNDDAKRSFADQLVTKFSDKYKENVKIVQKERIRMRTQAINTVLKDFYEFTTHLTFKSLIESTDEANRIKFSDCMFIVDEAQFINKTTTTKLTTKELSKNEAYDKMDYIFHLAERTKIIISSATPIMNETNEIISLANLLLPKERQIPNTNLENLPYSEFEKYFRGIISYVKTNDTFVDKIYVGEKLPNSDKVIYPIVMEGLQLQVYRSYDPKRDDPDNDDIEEFNFLNIEDINEGVRTDNIYIKGKQLSAIVFPDGSYGKKAFNKYFKKKDNKDYYLVPNDDLVEYLKIENLRYLSKKYYDIFNITENTPGKVFIFSEFIEGGGVNDLGAVFQVNGYEYFDLDDSIYKNQSVNSIYSALQPRKRVILLIGGKKKTEAKFAKYLDLYYDKRNMFGQYFKLIITSPVGQTSLNTNYVAAYISITSALRPGADVQSEFRVYRVDSHIEINRFYNELFGSNLTDEQRFNILIEKYGNFTADLYNEYKNIYLKNGHFRFPLKIYKMCSILPSSKDTVEYKSYKSLEEQSKKIDIVMNKLQLVAVDRYLHHERNKGKLFIPDFNTYLKTNKPNEEEAYNIIMHELRLTLKTKYELAINLVGENNINNLINKGLFTFSDGGILANTYIINEIYYLEQNIIDYLDGKLEVSITDFLNKFKVNPVYIVYLMNKLIRESIIDIPNNKMVLLKRDKCIENSYNILYSNEEVNIITEVIINLMKDVNSISIDDLFEELKDNNKMLIFKAIDKIVNDHELIEDKNGNISCIGYDNNILYKFSEFSIRDYNILTYNNIIPLYKEEKIISDYDIDQNIINNFENFDINIRIQILKDIITKYFRTKSITNSERNLYMKKLYDRNIFFLKYPFTRIALKMLSTGKGNIKKSAKNLKIYYQTQINNGTEDFLNTYLCIIIFNNEIHGGYGGSKREFKFTDNFTLSYMKIEENGEISDWENTDTNITINKSEDDINTLSSNIENTLRTYKPISIVQLRDYVNDSTDFVKTLFQESGNYNLYLKDEYILATPNYYDYEQIADISNTNVYLIKLDGSIKIVDPDLGKQAGVDISSFKNQNTANKISNILNTNIQNNSYGGGIIVNYLISKKRILDPYSNEYINNFYTESEIFGLTFLIKRNIVIEN